MGTKICPECGAEHNLPDSDVCLRCQVEDNHSSPTRRELILSRAGLTEAEFRVLPKVMASKIRCL